MKDVISNKNNALILGNNVCDFDISLRNRIKIFLDKCDFICTDNASYLDLVSIVNLFK